MREVWKAYTDFKTALRKQDSAAKLVTASQNAFDAGARILQERAQHSIRRSLARSEIWRPLEA